MRASVRLMTVAIRFIQVVWLAVSITLIATACTDPYADDVSSRDLRVMRATVDIACKLNAERIVVSDRPAVPRAGNLRGAESQNIQFGLDFNRRLAHEARWPRGQICPAVRVASDSSIKVALENETGFPGSWESFKAKFGGARSLMRISLPVYSPDGKHAVIYTEGTCPYTCGAGFYNELEKTYKGWKITSSVLAWNS
jgi:hypothetical protein